MTTCPADMVEDRLICSGGDEEEGEEAFALRVALLRLHRLQLLSGAASGEAALLKSLDKLLAVNCLPRMRVYIKQLAEKLDVA